MFDACTHGLRELRAKVCCITASWLVLQAPRRPAASLRTSCPLISLIAATRNATRHGLICTLFSRQHCSASQFHLQPPRLRRGDPAAPPRPRASTSESASGAGGDTSEVVPDDSFSLAKVSFGDILAPLGVGLLTFGFGAFFQLIPGSGVSGVVLISGFPLLLLGFALKYAQLNPVECKTTRAAFEARPTQMTDNLKQVREDCTRFRCALQPIDVHLTCALSWI